ncbi:MAG: NAD(P)H-hydrate dehydratase [Pseudomonadota bacterium]
MTDLLTAAQMRAIEQAAIEAGEVTGLELMERAGQGVVDAIMDWRPEFAAPREDGRPHRAAILCGPGNNGGDGFVVARLLKERGWEVEVFLFGREAEELKEQPSDAGRNARRWSALGKISKIVDAPRAIVSADVAVDALFGTGLSRPLSKELEEIRACWHEPFGDGRAVAVDISSGICADSGRGLEGDVAPLPASLTVTFHAAKLGHYLADGPMADRIVVVDIGLEKRRPAAGVRLVSPPSTSLHPVAYWEDAQSALAVAALMKSTVDHKCDHGHALVLSGGVGRGGAARLAARGALRVGAGLVTVGCPPAAVMENAGRLDAVMLRGVDGAAGFAAFEGLEKVSAVCVGPGFGVGERCRAIVAAVLSGGGVGPHSTGDGGFEPHPTGWGVVLDADALTSFEGDPLALLSMLHERCVLTPHMGEFRRLYPDIAAKLDAPAVTGPAYSKVDAAREAAARAGCTVLLKGADTVIASPDGRAAINAAAYERAAPWLATAGSGDVLAGLITGLLARGFDPQTAAETGAWLHVECALKFGPGLIAEDLPEQLPAVFRDLGL